MFQSACVLFAGSLWSVAPAAVTDNSSAVKLTDLRLVNHQIESDFIGLVLLIAEPVCSIVGSSKISVILHLFRASGWMRLRTSRIFVRSPQLGNGVPAFTIRIWWSVNVRCPLGNFTLGI